MTEQVTGGTAPTAQGEKKPGWRNFSVVPNQPSARIPTDGVPPNVQQVPVRQTERSSNLRGMMFAAVGFLAGIAFWHAVGFWTFVTDVVLNGPDGQARVAGAAPIKRSAPPRGEVVASPPRESRAAITTGSVTSAPIAASGAGSSVDQR